MQHCAQLRPQTGAPNDHHTGCIPPRQPQGPCHGRQCEPVQNNRNCNQSKGQRRHNSTIRNTQCHQAFTKQTSNSHQHNTTWPSKRHQHTFATRNFRTPQRQKHRDGTRNQDDRCDKENRGQIQRHNGCQIN